MTVSNVDEYFDKLFSKDRVVQEMFADNTYMDWLEKFTTKVPSYDSEVMYYKNLTEEDKKNLRNLDIFFKVIEHYASKNYISSTKLERVNGYYYLLSYHEQAYQIGLLYGTSTMFFCKKMPLEKNIDTISFDEVKKNTLRARTITINKKLEELTPIIQEALQEGVPADAICNKTKTLVKEMRLNKIGDNNE